MSEVEKVQMYVFAGISGFFVDKADYDAAQVELAALREELAKAIKDRETLLKLHVHLRARRSYWIGEETKAQQRLAAAEQRNGDLELSLMWVRSQLTDAVIIRFIDIALKPTESGASK